MKIETKYNYRDTVWTMLSDSPQQGFVTGIRIYLNNSGQNLEINYDIQTNGGSVNSRLEKKLFPTKEELIASL